MKTGFCPVCFKLTPVNELANYRRCEDCFVGADPARSALVSTQRRRLKDVKADGTNRTDRRGAAGQDLKRGELEGE